MLCGSGQHRHQERGDGHRPVDHLREVPDGGTSLLTVLASACVEHGCGVLCCAAPEIPGGELPGREPQRPQGHRGPPPSLCCARAAPFAKPCVGCVRFARWTGCSSTRSCWTSSSHSWPGTSRMPWSKPLSYTASSLRASPPQQSCVAACPHSPTSRRRCCTPSSARSRR